MQNCSHIFDDMNRLNTHMTVVHDTAPSALPKIHQIVSILKITGGRRQKAGGRRQEAGGRRQEAGGRNIQFFTDTLQPYFPSIVENVTVSHGRS